MPIIPPIPDGSAGGNFPVPTAIDPKALSLLQTALTIPGGVPTIAKSVVPLDTRRLSYLWNYNALTQDLLAQYATGVYAITKGLALSNGVELNVITSAGQAVVENIIELPADYTTPLQASRVAYMWFQQPGIPVPVYDILTPPTGLPAVYLGKVTNDGSVITSIDTSGVCYYRSGNIWRQTGDLFTPGDTPPAHVQLYTQTKTGLYFWNGLTHVSIATYDVASFTAGKPNVNAKIFGLVVTRSSKLLAAAPGSQFAVGTSAMAMTTFTVSKVSGGITTTVGTIVVSAAASMGVFTVASNVSLNPGDLLFVAAPGTQDATLADVALNIVLSLV